VPLSAGMTVLLFFHSFTSLSLNESRRNPCLHLENIHILQTRAGAPISRSACSSVTMHGYGIIGSASIICSARIILDCMFDPLERELCICGFSICDFGAHVLHEFLIIADGRLIVSRENGRTQPQFPLLSLRFHIKLLQQVARDPSKRNRGITPEI
jgi:hypothetical protein